MSTYKARASDQRMVDEADAGRDLMCAATGCPHRWSVDAGSGKLCSWHAWLPAHQWPQVTQERLDALAERAYAAQHKEPPAVRTMTRAEKLQTLRDLSEATAQAKHGGKKGWARKIIERHEEGECISPLVLRIAQFVARRVA